jgi:hypothetical protein
VNLTSIDDEVMVVRNAVDLDGSERKMRDTHVHLASWRKPRVPEAIVLRLDLDC